jgi:hypothetical protein
MGRRAWKIHSSEYLGLLIIYKRRLYFMDREVSRFREGIATRLAREMIGFVFQISI